MMPLWCQAKMVWYNPQQNMDACQEMFIDSCQFRSLTDGHQDKLSLDAHDTSDICWTICSYL